MAIATTTYGPLSKKEAGDLIKRRHSEWVENQKRWRFLEDSLEGGNRYRLADYTVDPTGAKPVGIPWYDLGFKPSAGGPEIDAIAGIRLAYSQIVDRNLVPHLAEVGPDGRDLYSMRLHRTPVPTNVQRAINKHLNRVFGRQVDRDGPVDLIDWWNDVDGSGMDIDRWIREIVAPIFLVLGQIDLVFSHPRPPDGVEIATRADMADYGLDSCVAGIILPENLVWWQLDSRTKLYTECLVFERREDGEIRWRHWTPDGCYVYGPNGEYDPDESYEYAFGRPPVVRIFDTRKARCGNVGQSRYESVAEEQKAIYNGISELILGDCEQSHAQLSGPEDYLHEGSVIPIGPGSVLPKKKTVSGSSVTYEGWEFVEPPKGSQDSVFRHIQYFDDQADRDASLLKPAGMTAGSTVSQSGISKTYDNQDLNAVLGEVSSSLQGLERVAAAMVLTVRGDGPPTSDQLKSVQIRYPRQYDLYSVSDLMGVLQGIQGVIALSGTLPETETELIGQLMQIALPGLQDERQRVIRDEIEAFVKARALVRGKPTGEPDDIQTAEVLQWS